MSFFLDLITSKVRMLVRNVKNFFHNALLQIRVLYGLDLGQ